VQNYCNLHILYNKLQMYISFAPRIEKLILKSMFCTALGTLHEPRSLGKKK